MDKKLRNMTSIYLLDDKDNVLLLYRIGSRVINDSYTGSAGGHFEEGELNEPKKCVLRELYEETGIAENEIDNLELRYVTLRYKKDEIRQNYYYFARLKEANREIKSIEGNLKWFSLKEANTLEMPYTAKKVFEHYVSVGKNTDKLYGSIATEDNMEFIELKEF